MVAVHASVDGRALHVLGLVLLASHIGDGVLVHPSVGSVGVTTVAGSSLAAVNQDLNGRDHVTLSAVGCDLDSIGDRRKGGMRPTGAAVYTTQYMILEKRSRVGKYKYYIYQ